MRPDGSCPSCGQVLEIAQPFGSPVSPSARTEPPDEEAAHSKAPWHFKVLLSVLAVYLAWRGVQGIEWVARHL